MQLYTFSGTGNSLHAARELAARFPDAFIIPILHALQAGEVQTHAGVVGLVFPIHAFSMPWAVRRFLETADFSAASYLFAVATRICFDKVFCDIDKLLSRQNKRLNASFCFEMPQTYIPIFEVYSPEECARVEVEMGTHLNLIERTVTNRETHRPKDPPGWALFSRVVPLLVTAWFQKVRFPNMEKSFYADQSCTGCGVCERVCLTGKIRMENGKPVWGDEVRCAYCFACLHYCPEQAIQIKGRKTAGKGRYHHPAIRVKDIAAQKG